MKKLNDAIDNLRKSLQRDVLLLERMQKLEARIDQEIKEESDKAQFFIDNI